MIIYKATNKINGKSYIGLTTRNLHARKLEHERHLNTEHTYFHKALLKYGKENFEWSIIDDSANTLQKLQQLETYYITLFNTLIPNGYNIILGGELNTFENRRNYNYGNNPAARSIINLTTMKIYDCMKRASEENNISVNSLKRAIDTKTPTLNCYWDYYEANKSYQQKIVDLEANKKGRKSVKNTETQEIFKTISEAANKYHCARKTIRDICNGIKIGPWEYTF